MLVKPLIDKVLITLEVDDKTSVLVLLSKDGTISRKGDGSTGNTSLPLVQGFSADGHFEALMMTVSEDIFPYAGVINNPARAGRDCKLSIIFQGANDVDYSFRVLYGEDSQGPPKELAQILINAVKITEPWYRQQIQPEKPEEKAWWQFWKPRSS
jgi:hypothetical protein